MTIIALNIIRIDQASFINAEARIDGFFGINSGMEEGDFIMNLTSGRYYFKATT